MGGNEQRGIRVTLASATEGMKAVSTHQGTCSSSTSTADTRMLSG